MLKFSINRKSLETIYFAYILSVFEYADVLWGNCTQQQCNEIENIQLEAGRIVTGATDLVKKKNDLGQFPIQSAQILTGCG